MGTPTEEMWPGVSSLKDYRTTFPNFSAQPLESVVNLDEMGIDLLKRMLKYDPTERISAKSAMGHVKSIIYIYIYIHIIKISHFSMKSEEVSGLVNSIN